MPRQIDTIIKNERDNLKKNSKEVYFKFHILVEQARNARIIADKFREHHMKLILHLNGIKDVTNYSRIALENFAVLELWKLFDKKRSEFHIWHVAEYLNKSSISSWIETNYNKVENDDKLIIKWRGDAIGHRGKAGFYAPNLSQMKFKNGRVSERKLYDFLIDYLCEIDRELWQTDVADIKRGMQASENNYKQRVEKEMKEIFKDYDDKK